MPKGAVSSAVHVMFAALLIGLLTTSIQCPLAVRTNPAGGEMRVFGVKIIYRVPLSSSAEPPNGGTRRAADLYSTTTVDEKELLLDDTISASLSSSSDSSSTDGIEVVELGPWMELHLRDLPASSLYRSLIAYLVFLSLSLLICIGIILLRFLQLMPEVRMVPATYATRVLLLCVCGTCLACMITAAIVVTKSQFYDNIVDGYFGHPNKKIALHVDSSIRSGFSCTIVACILSVIAVIIIPLHPST